MAGVDTTSTQERLQRMERLLVGTHTSFTHRAGGGGEALCALGDGFAGRRRLRAGRTPTDLEAKLLEVMRAVSFTDAEIRE
ncbi:hypothetical protein [Nocardia sp. SC052]|uniref:hypothetical protein n=1 Tax=Nocardia sichangensis TaxID=3385975 RepID=UPI00399F1E68